MDKKSRDYEVCLCFHTKRGEVEDFIREHKPADLKELCQSMGIGTKMRRPPRRSADDTGRGICRIAKTAIINCIKKVPAFRSGINQKLSPAKHHAYQKTVFSL